MICPNCRNPVDENAISCEYCGVRFSAPLTAGAIANPGLASIKAALAPADTNYYFYVLDPAKGVHHFSTTYEEHTEFIATLE